MQIRLVASPTLCPDRRQDGTHEVAHKPEDAKMTKAMSFAREPPQRAQPRRATRWGQRAAGGIADGVSVASMSWQSGRHNCVQERGHVRLRNQEAIRSLPS